MEAIAHIQAKRGIVAPNIGFRRQLMAWERQFDDAKARAAEEQRKQARGMGVLVKALSKWVGKSKSRRLSKGRLHDPET
ncbi:hypothetical protein J3R82DRAFT_2326 [Butyriboletus roseoflavus]|nr:hypothetical protein J3R82DRAFT_2326 [Butyriboletus roseoflavus]